MPQISDKYDLTYTQNRELSWLKFNQRVLEESTDNTVPLLERLRFVSIFTSNLDEFFMVRVGSLFDLSLMTPTARENKSGKTPAEQLEMIYDTVRPLIRFRDAIYADLSKELTKQGIRDIAYHDLTAEEKHFIKEYYKENIRPLLSPQIIDRSHPFPHLKNKILYAAALLNDKNKEMLGLVGVPETVPPIVFMPGEDGAFIRTEEILKAHLKKIFKIYEIEETSVAAVTRNADISFDDEKFDEDNPDYRTQMTKLLRQRDKLAPVRLECQGDAPRLTSLLTEMLKLNPNQVFPCSCPLNLGYAYLLNKDNADLYYPPRKPEYPRYLTKALPMWEQVHQRDILLFYPYHSMRPFLDLLKESAQDPQVVSVKITIYRLAQNSAVVKYLCEAAENGKEVTVLMELRARFDEKNNIQWAKALEDAGCRIIYGPENFKCHSKICLITRKEKSHITYVTQIGTGNYNEKTSALYTDFSLMTANHAIAEDAVSFFQNMLIGNLQGDYKKLLVAPAGMKSTIINLIDREIAKGDQGRIMIKVNSLTERQLIDKLSEASCAGVKIDLIVRGICCLVPGIPGKTRNITVTSIIGRFLEHSRVYSFGEPNHREQELYISSADIMTRNQTRRVEIACPILSEELRRWYNEYLMILLSDNLKARRLLPDGNYTQIPPGKHDLLSSQRYYEENHITLTPTVIPHNNIFQRLYQKFHR